MQLYTALWSMQMPCMIRCRSRTLHKGMCMLPPSDSAPLGCEFARNARRPTISKSLAIVYGNTGVMSISAGVCPPPAELDLLTLEGVPEPSGGLYMFCICPRPALWLRQMVP